MSADDTVPLGYGRFAVHRASEIFGVSVTDIISHRRHVRCVKPRHAVCLALRERFGWSYPRIARVVGMLDHTSAISAIRSAYARLEDDQDYAERTAALLMALKPFRPERASEAMNHVWSPC